MPPDLWQLQVLTATHRGETAARRSRVKSIIKAFRPCYRITDRELPGSLDAPQDFDDGQVEKMRDLVRAHGASVGCVRVERADGQLVKVGTAFRVPGGPRRMATARHVLSAMLRPTAFVDAAFPFAASEAARTTSVSFADDGAGPGIPVDKVVWAHPIWDLLLFDLADDPQRDPLTLETRHDWGAASGNAISLVSYPIRAAAEDASLAESVVGETGVRRLSPGMADCRGAVATPLPAATRAVDFAEIHDATTLRGSSGAPIFALATMRVVGLHFNGRDLPGGDGQRAGNYYVNLPLALEEPELRREMMEAELSAVPRTWEPDLPMVLGVPESLLGLAAPESVQFVDPGPTLATIRPDLPDIRDRRYRPALVAAPDELMPPEAAGRSVPHQMGEPSCAGFALAAAIDLQLARLGRAAGASPRMLYDSAQLYDEWIDDGSGGTSLRGAIKGFFHSGACLSEHAPYRPGEAPWSLSIAAAKEARRISLGAYYRLDPCLVDFQVALVEADAIVASARIHKGWLKPDADGAIHYCHAETGTHAFAIVGYDAQGFVVANSWGAGWSTFRGRPGHARWSYRDWAENLIDAWVLRLAPSAPDAFDVVPRAVRAAEEGARSPVPALPQPRRFTLLGHSAQTEVDRIVVGGRLGMSLAALRETALYLGSHTGRKKYPHLLLVCHDPMLGAETIGRLAGNMVETFKSNGIYPLHLAHGIDEAITLRLRLCHEAAEAVKAFSLSGERIDSYLEARSRQVGAAILEALAASAKAAVRPGGPLWQVWMSIALEAGRRRDVTLFAAGTGSLAGDALSALARETSAARETPPFSGSFRLAPLTPSPGGYRWEVGYELAATRQPLAELGGYVGDWTHLLRAMRGGDVDRQASGTSRAAHLAPAMHDKGVLNALLRAILGRRPSAMTAFRDP